MRPSNVQMKPEHTPLRGLSSMLFLLLACAPTAEAGFLSPSEGAVALASPKMGGVKLAKGDAMWSVVGPILQQEFNKVDKDKDTFLSAPEYNAMWLASGADAATIRQSVEGVTECGVSTATTTVTPGGGDASQANGNGSNRTVLNVTADQTGDKADKVALRYTLTNMDYNKLKDNDVLKSGVIEAIKAGVLSGLPSGYNKEDIHVLLSAGSVIAAVRITPKSGMTAAQLHSSLNVTIQAAMVSKLTVKVLAVPNLNATFIAGKADIQVLSVPASVQKPTSIPVTHPGTTSTTRRAAGILPNSSGAYTMIGSVGDGYCPSVYLRRNKSISNASFCQTLCSKEEDCMYVSYSSNANRTCFRYNSLECSAAVLVPGVCGLEPCAYTTWKKTVKKPTSPSDANSMPNEVQSTTNDPLGSSGTLNVVLILAAISGLGLVTAVVMVGLNLVFDSAKKMASRESEVQDHV